ncbi:MAG: 30S ribosomal protein S4 [Phycisphaerales bacterium]|jgi:small subunit ribosomal protein S4
MGTYHGPKVRLTRRLGSPVSETNKHTNLRRDRRPGMHTRARRHSSLYGERLTEKQKLASYYNVRERQFARYIQEAQKTPGATTNTLHQILETRFDNVIRRAHWARTIWQARQMVSHGHFRINGHKVDYPASQVKAGDVITVKAGSEEFVRASIESSNDVASVVPEWLNVDNDNLKTAVVRLPAPGEIRLPFEIDLPKVVEMYTR